MSTFLVALVAGFSSPAFAHSDHHGHSHSHARPAQSGTVKIKNSTGRSLDLYVDGRFVQSVRSGTTSVRLSLGSHAIALKSGDRTIERRSVDVRAHSVATIKADKPTSGVVIVSNHEHYDVWVYVDGRRHSRIAANGSTELHIHGQARIDLVDERGTDRMLTTRSVDVGYYDVIGISWGTAVASSSHSSGHVRPR